LALRRAAVVVPLALERAVFAAPPAAAPADLAARPVLVAPDFACVAVRLDALRALVPVALAPLAAARLPLVLLREDERLDDERPELDDDERFGAGIAGLLYGLRRSWREPTR
jgi:hypothetical protein